MTTSAHGVQSGEDAVDQGTKETRRCHSEAASKYSRGVADDGVGAAFRSENRHRGEKIGGAFSGKTTDERSISRLRVGSGKRSSIPWG